MRRRLNTIGVHGWSLDEFLAALAEHDVAVLVDVRQRRGVRGPQYAWANSQRLQAALADAGIAYVHRKDLAPTTELRELQYAADELRGEGKRSRSEISPEYHRRYLAEILDEANLEELVAELPATRSSALLCVELRPEACHRSLIAERLRQEHGFEPEHLRPDRV